MRTKEFLSKNNIEFKSYNVLQDEAAMQKLRDMGIKSVPILIVGDKWAHPINPESVAELVGVKQQPRVQLSPPELIDKCRIVIEATQRYIRQVPDDKLGYHSPDRDRPIRNLAYHVFLIVDGMVNACKGAGLVNSSVIAKPAPAWMKTAEHIARYGTRVRSRLDAWAATLSSESFEQIVPTYYGEETWHRFMERSAWHSTQHSRQVILFLTQMGIEPDKPLTDEDLAGLPLPDAVWH